MNATRRRMRELTEQSRRDQAHRTMIRNSEYYNESDETRMPMLRWITLGVIGWVVLVGVILTVIQVVLGTAIGQ